MPEFLININWSILTIIKIIIGITVVSAIASYIWWAWTE